MQSLSEASGLSESLISLIKDTVCTDHKIHSLILFGSRAMGTYKNGSDIDLAVKTHAALKLSELLHIQATLDGLDLPYEFDLVNYHTLENQALKEHIDRVGITIK